MGRAHATGSQSKRSQACLMYRLVLLPRRLSNQAMTQPAHRLIHLFTFAAGLMQALVAFSLLFLPVFTECIHGPSMPLSCQRHSYFEMGGTATGYLTLIFMLIFGGLAGITTRFEMTA